MKRVIFATVAFCLVDAVLATTCRIGVRKDDNTDMVKVSCNWKTEKSLEVGEIIDFGAIGAGFWDGTSFFMSEGNLSADDVKISSKEIPIVFDLLPLLLYSTFIFVDSSIRNRNLWVGLLSVPAAFTQLMGYGLGFIESWWKRCVLKQDEFTAFEKNFYK